MPPREALDLSFEAFERRVLFEDGRLLVVDKPAGLATMGASAGEASLFTFAQRYIKVKYEKPGAVYLGVVSRLDLPVSGVVVFARNSKAAKRLNEQIQARTVRKIYRALVEGVLEPPEAECVDFICEDPKSRRLWIPKAASPGYLRRLGAKEARLTYRRVESYAATTLVEVELETGRKHQIRLQLSKRGAPIVGDGKYGAHPVPERGIGLHAARFELTHPTTGERLSFESPPPGWWGRYAR